MKTLVFALQILILLKSNTRNSLLAFLLLLALVSPSGFTEANETCSKGFAEVSKENESGAWEYGDTTISWSVFETRKDGWGREYRHRFYYADAGISPAGILYFNLRTVSKKGVHTKALGGREFFDEAVSYFKKKGRIIAGVKGWWVFRDDEKSDATLEQQVEENPLSSINFTEYYRNRKVPNDKEAASKTWTAKVAASLGFSEISSISEQFQRNGYKAVYVTFTSKNPPIDKIRKDLANEKGEIYIDLEKAMEQTGMGEDPTRIYMLALANLVVSNSMLLQILGDNSLIASDFAALGFEFESFRKRIIEASEHSERRSALILKIK